ncbi:3' exoribonuclease family, domain 1 [Carpediemonas membranifera]|uniref:3' exoribonuclease family, domain 1 n=1 Tax=Carpediemonas membranifera TaxID=201153 RepID=A0A8J6BCF9_9EUKA|nr:3' exoribonuclease family, domain 1 [Carpediemonas membranifera]|eukprot:KAG9394527.1 3' exoribonuclease family, domain 1 [Carpediemonas membranifera]
MEGTVELSSCSGADGSCIVRMNKNTSIAHGSMTWMRRGTRHETQQLASITVTFRFPSGTTTDDSRAVGAMLSSAFANILDQTKLPATDIDVTVAVVCTTSDIWTLGVYATLFSLMDGGVPLVSYLVPQTVAVGQDDAVIATPTPEQTEEASGVCRVAFNRAGKAVFVDARGKIADVKRLIEEAATSANECVAWVRSMMG